MISMRNVNLIFLKLILIEYCNLEQKFGRKIENKKERIVKLKLTNSMA
jgi:hypothetical protein